MWPITPTSPAAPVRHQWEKVKSRLEKPRNRRPNLLRRRMIDAIRLRATRLTALVLLKARAWKGGLKQASLFTACGPCRSQPHSLTGVGQPGLGIFQALSSQARNFALIPLQVWLHGYISKYISERTVWFFIQSWRFSYFGVMESMSFTSRKRRWHWSAGFCEVKHGRKDKTKLKI